MTASDFDATTGHPIFADGDAPDVAQNATEVAEFAASVGTRLIGSTAERTAYSYAHEGLRWWDTDDDTEYLHDGSGWVPIFHGWKSWTPSRVNNISGALTAQYMRIGDLIRCRIVWTLTGGNISGNNPSWSLPVTADVSDTQFANGTVTCDDANGAEYPGCVRITASTAVPYYQQVSGSNVQFASVNATSPFTWASGDRLILEFDYRAA